jgi:hypothetical protein
MIGWSGAGPRDADAAADVIVVTCVPIIGSKRNPWTFSNGRGRRAAGKRLVTGQYGERHG